MKRMREKRKYLRDQLVEKNQFLGRMKAQSFRLDWLSSVSWERLTERIRAMEREGRRIWNSTLLINVYLYGITRFSFKIYLSISKIFDDHRRRKMNTDLHRLYLLACKQYKFVSTQYNYECIILRKNTLVVFNFCILHYFRFACYLNISLENFFRNFFWNFFWDIFTKTQACILHVYNLLRSQH